MPWRVAVLMVLAFSGCLSTDDGSSEAEPYALDATQCALAGRPGCRATDEAFYVSGATMGALPGQEVGLRVWLTDRDVIIQNLSLTGFPIGLQVLSTCASCKVIVKGLTLNGTEGSVGIDMRQMTETASIDFSASSVLIEGYGRAVGWFGTATTTFALDDFRVRCKNEGLVVSARSVHLANGTVTGCVGSGARLSGYRVAHVTSSTFDGNGQGLALAGHQMGAATVVDSKFFSNGVGGLYVGLSSTSVVERNTFINNGHAERLPNVTLPAGRAHALRIDFADVVVRGNCFSGNPGWGVSANALQGVVDARENWWGDPAGPRAGVSQGDELDHPMGVPLGSGDFIEGLLDVSNPLASPGCT